MRARIQVRISLEYRRRRDVCESTDGGVHDWHTPVDVYILSSYLCVSNRFVRVCVYMCESEVVCESEGGRASERGEPTTHRSRR